MPTGKHLLNRHDFGLTEIHHEGLCLSCWIPVTQHLQYLVDAGVVLILRHEHPDDNVVYVGRHAEEEHWHSVASCFVCGIDQAHTCISSANTCVL